MPSTKERGFYMKFNPDCVRDILLTAEDNVGYNDPMVYGKDADFPLLNKYSFDEVVYHIEQCALSNLLTFKPNILDELKINNILPGGHELLSSIREEAKWKEILKKGVTSIPTIISTVNNLLAICQKITPP